MIVRIAQNQTVQLPKTQVVQLNNERKELVLCKEVVDDGKLSVCPKPSVGFDGDSLPELIVRIVEALGIYRLQSSNVGALHLLDGHQPCRVRYRWLARACSVEQEPIMAEK